MKKGETKKVLELLVFGEDSKTFSPESRLLKIILRPQHTMKLTPVDTYIVDKYMY